MDEQRRAQREKIEAEDNTPVGLDLATAVAGKLRAGASILNCHRDYCGHALAYLNNAYAILEIHDGNLEWGEVIVSFTEEAAFIAFLAKQTDNTLSGCDASAGALYAPDAFRQNNQRLTRGRLQRFVVE